MTVASHRKLNDRNTLIEQTLLKHVNINISPYECGL